MASYPILSKVFDKFVIFLSKTCMHDIIKNSFQCVMDFYGEYCVGQDEKKVIYVSTGICIPLTFATFYICGVKDLTTYRQRICVNILLKNIYPEKGVCSDTRTLTDTYCTNFVKGRRALNNDLQKELNELSEADAIERLEKLGIQDKAIMANALRFLVENSSLSENEKRELLESFQSEDKLTFIAKVFLKSVKGNNDNPVTDELIKMLTRYRTQSTSLAGQNSNSTISENQKSVNKTDMFFHSEARGNGNLTRKSDSFSCSKLEYGEFDLPNDYQKLMDILKVAMNEANLQSFQINEFIEAMDIDTIYNNLKEGYLEYWKVEGKIFAPFKKYNFSDVSAFAIHLIGHFDLSQSKKIEEFLRKASNDNVTVLTSLCYKEETDIKLILLVHRNERKATEQKLDNEHDGTKVYKRN